MKTRVSLLLLLAGCATAPIPHYESRYITLQHGTGRFQSAQEQARGYCAQAMLKPRHLGTDTPPGALSLSRFECIAE